MPCRSPQTVSVAQPTTYLSSMSQQPNQTQQHNASQQQHHQSQLGSINGRASAVAAAVNAAQQQQLLTSQQQQVSAVASAVALPLQLAAAQAQQQNAQQQQNGKKPSGLRDLYTEKALADIKNSLRPYEAADGQPLRPVSSLSTGSSNNSDYSNIILSLMNMGFDEVSQEFYFICFFDVFLIIKCSLSLGNLFLVH